MAEELGAFAAFTGEVESPFQDELARRKVLSVSPASGFRLDKEYLANRPFTWSFAPTSENLQKNLAELACNSLAGKLASHGGNPTAPRKFAILVERAEPPIPNPELLTEGLARCGEHPRVEWFGNKSNDESSRQVLLADLRASGVTSIFCMCDWVQPIMVSAQQVVYQPEWILPRLPYENQQQWANNDDLQGQRTHMFGLWPRNKLRPLSDEPWYWAAKESDSNFTIDEAYLEDNGLRPLYDRLLLLASGIQMAGPLVTPQAFEAGLHRTKFPNPGAGAPPYWQGSIGFGAGDYTMIDDVALWWWDDTRNDARGTVNRLGQVCFVNRGERWSLGRWPKGDLPLFDRTKPCR